MIVVFFVGQAVASVCRGLKNHHPQGHMHLRSGEASAIRVHHGLEQIGHQTADFGGGGIRHRLGDTAQDRVAHPGDFQDCHNYSLFFKWLCDW